MYLTKFASHSFFFFVMLGIALLIALLPNSPFNFYVPFTPENSLCAFQELLLWLPQHLCTP